MCPSGRGTRWSWSNAGSTETTLEKSLSGRTAKETLRMDKIYKRCEQEWEQLFGWLKKRHILRHPISGLATCWGVFGLNWESLLLQGKFSPVAYTYLLVC